MNAGDVEVVDGARCYPQPFDAGRQITGMLSLLGEGLSREVTPA